MILQPSDRRVQISLSAVLFINIYYIRLCPTEYRINRFIFIAQGR